jgi:two-component system cell cycle response regulator DivK
MTNHHKILLVEDDEINAKLIKDFLTYKGYTIILTNNGNEVKGLVEREVPALILMDIQIFGKSGVDVAADLRSDVSTKAIPIFAVSAFSQKKVLTPEQSELFDEYIEKPIRFAEFTAILASYLKEGKGV